MKHFIIIFFFLAPNLACACNSGELGNKLVENAYFIGLVEQKYYKKYDNGFFKETALRPFMVYKSKDALPLNEDIIISNDMKWTACDYYPYPENSRIIEIILLKNENGYELAHPDMIHFLGERLISLRKKVRYVGDLK